MAFYSVYRALLQNSVSKSSLLRKCPVYNRVCSKSFSVSIGARSDKYIYKSPYPDIELPKVSLLEYLRQESKTFDDRIALVSAETGEELLVGQLWDKVERCASALAKLGVGKGSTVALVSPNCPEYVIGFLATIAAGATVTTVNSLYTGEEIARQIVDSGASAVLYHPGTADAVLEATQQLPSGTVAHRICTHNPVQSGDLCLGTLCGDDGLAYPKSLEVDILNDVAILPYSSGTTGLPKGVMLTNSCTLINVIQASTPGITFQSSGGTDVMFSVLPMFHMYGMVANLLLSIVKGVKCVTFTKFDPVVYTKAIIKYQPTVMHLVPPILQFLVINPQLERQHMASVLTIVCGATKMAQVLVDQVHQKFGDHIQFQEGYGLSEMSPICNITRLGEFVPGSCGPPVPNTMCKLVHVETGKTLSPEEGEGELCVKGPQMMKGYLNNPSATAEIIDSEGWLHTGDVARFDTNGHVYIVDRLKELIKVKGFQVAPAELESILKECPGVLEAGVIGVEDDRQGEVPRAYVVKDPKDGSVTAEQIHAFMAKKVAPHKQLQGGVVFMDSIPKNQTGKILRRELRELAAST